MRKVFGAAAVSAALVMCPGSGRLFPETPQATGAAQPSRIAVFDLGEVVRRSPRFKVIRSPKTGDQQQAAVYKEIQAAARDYATAHGIELVLHYNSAAFETDPWTPESINRRRTGVLGKMQAAGCFPASPAPALDITNELLNLLENRNR